jgi:hypothetical protein
MEHQNVGTPVQLAFLKLNFLLREEHGAVCGFDRGLPSLRCSPELTL